MAIMLLFSSAINAAAMQEVFSGSLGNVNFHAGGGHMAVSEVMYTLPGAFAPAQRIVCAISNGQDKIMLLTLNNNANPPSVTLRETLTVQNLSLDQHVFDISFMTIETGPTSGPRSCLVIPVYDRSISNSGTIYVFDLETRTLYEDCLSWRNFRPPRGEVVHVGQQKKSSNDHVYTVSIEGEIYIASLDNSGGKPVFKLDTRHNLGNCYYAAASDSFPFRAYETYNNIGCNSLTTTGTAITTGHVGGVLLWDPLNTESPVLGWIRCAQVGWSDHNIYLHGKMVCGTYLGDIHRVAVLNDEDDHPALIFCTTAGMGFLVYDIHDPREPKFVWQWDNDTRIHANNGVSSYFSWFGSGSGDVASGYIPGTNAPGEVFGVGLSRNPETRMIHVYIGNGIDGLRAFDFSHFFSVFEDGFQPARNFRHFEVFHQSKLSDASNCPMLAWEVRTHTDLSGDTYVFTTWKDRIGDSGDPIGELALTVHRDTAPALPYRADRYDRNHSNLPQALSVGFSSPNPAEESVVFDLGSPDEHSVLSIYDMSGRLVRRDTPAFRDGRASCRWNLDNGAGVPVPNGVYFARLSDGSGNSVSVRCTVIR